MARPRSERFHNRDNIILSNKWRLEKLPEYYSGPGLWRQPTNITSMLLNLPMAKARGF
jgi:hypothetical protein